jgi:RNA polymerase sigma-54 factor
MAIELKQQLRMSQQLVMTPQLQQAIKLLQLNQLELVGLVEQELQENPVLEEAAPDEQVDAEGADPEVDAAAEQTQAESESADAEAGSTDDSSADSSDLEVAADLSGEDASRAGEGEQSDPTDAEKIADIEWENYLESNPQTGLESGIAGGDDDRPSLEQTLSSRPTLTDHLEGQVGVSDFDEEETEIAHWIIGNLDERGYLCSSVEEIARQCGAEVERVEATLAKVQRLDPPGVAARDLRECLIAQLRVLRVRDGLVYDIVDQHLDLLQKRDFRGLSRATGATPEEVAAANRVIASLEPRPARDFGGDEPVYITPDIYVHKIGEDFHVLLNEDGLPKLKINNVYKDVLTHDGDSSDAKDTKNYVQDKVRSAMWLIKSIHQRQRTIVKVMQSIIQHQNEFFEKGVAYLKPLNLRDVADDIGMHESTVSRVTTNKYAHTPQGIFELKYFFNSSINRVDGDAIASESVKEKIRKIITSEDPRRPLSDQRIAEMLKTRNIDIARRTVTKYRESMNILSSTKRRQVG